MAIKRRTFLASGMGLAAFPLWGTSLWGSSVSSPFLYANASANDQDAYFLELFDPSGKVISQFPLPSRGHSFAYASSSQQLAAFARRPETYAIIIDLQTFKRLNRIESPQERHFYGHGVFSQDGRWLFATENNYATSEGLIGVYDANNGYRRVTEFPTYGIGPHDIRLLSDGNTLVVANGGIQTHPDYGRQKLNLKTMDSFLAYIDIASQRLLGTYRLPKKFQKMSIRHLAITPEDQVVLAMQYQGPRSHHYPLVGIHAGGSDIALLPAPSPIDRRMKNYCGSLAVDVSGTYLGVSSPRGGVITFWSIPHQRYLGHVDVEDGCGIAASGEKSSFLISSGTGKLFQSTITSQATIHTKHLTPYTNRWDNHMAVLS